MSSQVQTPKKVSVIRAAMVALSPLQRDLRKAVTDRMGREDHGVSDVAHLSKISWAEAKRFLDGLAVGGGARLVGLCEYVQRPDLFQSIKALAEPYSSTPTLALAAYDVPIINLILDLHESYQAIADLRMESFAAAFGDDKDVVAGVLVFDQEAYEHLKDTTRAQRILDHLASNELMPCIEAAKHESDRRKQETCAQLEPLIVEGVQRYGSRPAFAVTLKLPKGTFSVSKLKQTSKERLEELIRLATTHLQMQAPHAPAEVSSDRPTRGGSAPPPPQKTVIVSEEQIAPPVTGKTFVLIDVAEPDAIELEFMAKRIMQVRTLLDRCAQIKSPQIRARIRTYLSLPVEELILSTKLFTYEFPNRAIHLLDAERENMETLGEAGIASSTKPTRKRS